jgi:3-hydroxyisobutyrate dehydrogenase
MDLSGTDIAVLGMGRMGQALAGRLVAGGHHVTIWNRTPGRAPDLVAAGAKEAGSIGEAVAGAGVSITSLANDDAVRAVALGPDGIISAKKPDAMYADASTISPALSGELATTVRHFVAMPILGGPATVVDGQATYLLGGDPVDVAALDPVVATLSASVRRYADAQHALTAKLVNNQLLLSGLVSLAEAVAVGRAGGLTDDQLRDLLENSAMVAPGIRNRFEGVLTGHQDPGWWTISLGGKDLRLAAEVANDRGIDVPVALAVQGQFQWAAEAGLADHDVAEVSRDYSDDHPARIGSGDSNGYSGGAHYRKT